MPSSAEIARADAMTSACSSGVPCEKFKRKTLAPETKSERRIAGSREAGPTVATIFVRFCRMGSITRLPCASSGGRLLRSIKRT